MLIKAEHVRVGDVILTPSNSHLRCLKVVSLPKKANSNTFRCTRFVEEFTFNSGTKYLTERFNLNTEEHNDRVSVDLSYRDIWLISRENHD